MFNLTTILNAVKLAGSELPAFKALFDSVVGTFGKKDQATLKASYADAMKRSDAAHGAVQDELR